MVVVFENRQRRRLLFPNGARRSHSSRVFDLIITAVVIIFDFVAFVVVDVVGVAI